MKNSLLIIPFLLISVSCSSLKVVYDYDKEVDFTAFRTMSFMDLDMDKGAKLNDLDRRRFKRALMDEFESRNIVYMDEGGDLTVTFHVIVDSKTQVQAYTDYYGMYGWGYGYYGYYGGPGYSTTQYREYEYQEGSLICDVFDTANKKLIWQGIASAEIKEGRDPDTVSRYVIKQIMKNYPIKPL